MTFKDIMTTVGSSVAVTTVLILGIKANELYKSTSDTVEKANKIVDTIYKHDADIDSALNLIYKVRQFSSPTPVDPLAKPNPKK